jgi:putative transposase
MDEYESLSHTKWDCKYHVIFIPKCRTRTIYVELRPEGHLLADHVHNRRKYAVSQVVGFIKGKSAIHLARVYGEKKRNYVGPRLHGIEELGDEGWRRSGMKKAKVSLARKIAVIMHRMLADGRPCSGLDGARTYEPSQTPLGGGRPVGSTPMPLW